MILKQLDIPTQLAKRSSFSVPKHLKSVVLSMRATCNKGYLGLKVEVTVFQPLSDSGQSNDTVKPLTAFDDGSDERTSFVTSHLR
ncbi:hypothetical protein RL2152 [Rhizobium johnstonii 3841]|uniref:Uncharacterized protein n=1 Tax=Rhizobium johnstonii (strain DSM 114642 / LMG 32736 / 3841) TaxID=216596 RepID=Q1MHC1_RHIJ3|nr:hypothetical protein RL2152 [Rhizobium johnstonii 3841]